MDTILEFYYKTPVRLLKLTFKEKTSGHEFQQNDPRRFIIIFEIKESKKNEFFFKLEIRMK